MSPEHGPEWESGMRAGQIQAIETMLSTHEKQLTDHGKRLTALERVAWALLGASAILQMPEILTLFGKGG